MFQHIGKRILTLVGVLCIGLACSSLAARIMIRGGGGGPPADNPGGKNGLHIPGGKNVNFNYNMTDGGGFRWDIQYNGNVGQGTNYVYSGGMYLQIGGNNIGGSGQGWTNESGDEVETGPYQNGNLKIYRRVKVYKDRGLARWMDIFENTTGTDQNLTVQVYSYLNYGVSRTITSSGGAAFGEKDFGFVTETANGGGNNVPSLAHIVCDKRAKTRPTINMQNNQLYVAYNIRVPANKSVVLVSFESQNNSVDDLQKLLKQFQPAKMLKDLAPAVRKMIVNFQVAGGILDELELDRNELTDGVFLNNGDPVFGVVTNEQFIMETGFGKMTLPAKQVIAMVAGAEEGTLKAVMSDGQIISGKVLDDKLTVEIPSMGTLKIPMERIRQLAYRITKDKPEEIPFAGPYVSLRTGDRVAFAPKSLQLSFRTKQGVVPLDANEVLKVMLDNTGNGVHRAVFVNGSSMAGFVLPEKISADLKLGSKLSIDRNMVQQFDYASEEAPDETLTCVQLSNGDKVFGELVDNKFKLATDFGEMTVLPGSIRSITFSRAQSGRAVVTLWDRTVLRGQLEQDELEFQLLPGPKMLIPPGECEMIVRTHALPPREIRDKVDKLVGRLGSEFFKDRQDATEELLKLGKNIVPILKKHAETKDPEVRQRIEDIIDKLGGSGASPSPGGDGPMINAQWGLRCG